MAVPYGPDWRWLLGRDDSPWYPSMRLFRQQTRGDSHSVFERIAVELASRLIETCSVSCPALQCLAPKALRVDVAQIVVERRVLPLKPILQALVLAEHIYTDVSGKKIITSTGPRLSLGR